MTTPRPARSEHVRLGGLSTHFLQWGDRSNSAVLLLHGLRSYAATWEVLAQDLAADHWVLALDFRGRGHSEWDPQRQYFTETYVRDVEEWVSHLGLRHLDLLGHSMGGTVGYVYAARHPDQVTRLVVEDIGPDSSVTSPGARRVKAELSRTPASFASREAAREYWQHTRPEMPRAAIDSRVEHTLREAEGRWVWRSDMEGIGEARLRGDPAAGIDLWRCVESLRCPTLVVRGEQSDFLSSGTCAVMAERQPLLRWRTVSSAGHYVHDDNPGEYVDIVGRFFRDPA